MNFRRVRAHIEEHWRQGASPEQVTARSRARRVVFHLFSSIWLVTLSGPIGALLGDHPSRPRLLLGLAGAAVFALGYIWQLWNHPLAPGVTAPQGPLKRRLPLGLLTSVAIAMTLGFGADWLLLYIFCGVVAGFVLPGQEGVIGIGIVLAVTIVTGAIAGAAVSDLSGDLLTIAGLGLLMLTLARLTYTVRELNAAREEVTRLAVSEERLRFARDLHDLLGHSLSLIALKSELAWKLTAPAPDRAVAEMKDVEAVARKALAEVREAVAGYRQPTLASELTGAREMLAAAGIQFTERVVPVAVPAPVEAALAWTVREGVTNVIRHSRAKRSRIEVEHDEDGVTVAVIDDGRGAASVHAEQLPGNGLEGLQERIAALGGRFAAGPNVGGGFRLAVWVPAVVCRAGAESVCAATPSEAAIAGTRA